MSKNNFNGPFDQCGHNECDYKCDIKKQKIGVETNGPAAIMMIIEDILSRTNMDKNTRNDLMDIYKLSSRTVEYIKRLENVNQVNWSDFK